MISKGNEIMSKFIRSGLNFILKGFDLILLESEENWEREAFAKLYEARIQHEKTYTHSAEGIVFSKDRALQLHALLSSYLEKVISPAPLHILYTASTFEHQKAYQKLMEIFSGKFLFIKQSSDDSFRNDLLRILDSISTEKTFFLVDDILFIEDFDMKDFIKFNTDEVIPTLRMGLNLTECYTIQKEQPLPEFISDANHDGNKMFWIWDKGMHGWSYPLSVDGHFFSTQEITAITKLINFSAPNTYEDQLQKFRRLFLFRKGVCYTKSKIVNIPCNKVQKENKNIFGKVHQDYLLERWLNGYQMDYRKVYGFNNVGSHQEIPFDFIRRS